MVKLGLVLTAAVTLAACGDLPGHQSSRSAPFATTAEARDCVVMGYRVGTTRHDYCVQVIGRRLTPEEYN